MPKITTDNPAGVHPAGIRPPQQGGESYLADETPGMDRQRRTIEQAGHKRLAQVHVREHADSAPSMGMEEGLEQPLSHPLLLSQKNDGIDNPLSPEPALNTEARREFDNERREQEKEKQLRLGNMPNPKFSPRPPGAS